MKLVTAHLFFPQIQFREKLLWTAITLFIFLVCCQVSIERYRLYNEPVVTHSVVLDTTVWDHVF